MTNSNNLKKPVSTAVSAEGISKPKDSNQTFQDMLQLFLEMAAAASENRKKAAASTPASPVPQAIPQASQPIPQASQPIPVKAITEQELIPVEELGVFVQSERRRQKITREVLSKLSGVSVGTIIAIEQKKTTVTIATAQKVLRAFGKKLWIR